VILSAIKSLPDRLAQHIALAPVPEDLEVALVASDLVEMHAIERTNGASFVTKINFGTRKIKKNPAANVATQSKKDIK